MPYEMPVVTDLISLQTFFEMAVNTLGTVDDFHAVSSGSDGVKEINSLFERTIKPGQTVAPYQVAETPLTDNAAGLTQATFACTLMIVRKMDSTVQTQASKLEARNDTWLRMLRLLGLIRQAAEWYAANVTEVAGQAYEIEFRIFQDKLQPLGSIANAHTQGWLVDLDVTIPVNGLMYS